MSQDRVSRVRVSGMRSLADISIELPLDHPQVLIGDNGSGKSTLVEAFELLHKAHRPGRFVIDSLNNFHGGLDAVLRQDARELALEVRIEGGGPPIDYRFSVGRVGTVPQVQSERIDLWEQPDTPKPLNILQRNGHQASLFVPGAERAITEAVDPFSLCLHEFGGIKQQPALPRLVDALKRLDVHTPFDTRPLWLLAELQPGGGPQQPGGGMRMPQLVDEAAYVARQGANLANCLQTLRNHYAGELWNDLLMQSRLGLGDDLRDLVVRSPSRGNIELWVYFGRLLQPIPASALSEGQLAYLGFVALSELGKSRSVIVFDEPELHLHPGLLVRVVWMLERLAKTVPVVIATHSDRLLDALSEPASSAILCELDETRATHLRRPDGNALQSWLEDYRGLGQLRAEGYEPHVFTEEQTTPCARG